MLPHKKVDGKCPYCASNNFLNGAERKPGQRVDRCNVCNQYSVFVPVTSIRYPLDDPQNSQSPPHN